MDIPVSKLFVILALNPEKGRIAIDSIHFRYSLTGALFMEYSDDGEFKVENKRIVPFFKNNGEVLHDMIADKIMNSGKNRRISFWISRITQKSRFILREITSSLEKDNIIRIEHKKFLNIIPYKKYWLIDSRTRSNLIEVLRGILLYGKQPGKKDFMLLGLLEASRAYSLLSRERGESKLLRKKNSEILKGDVMSAEISQVIVEVQTAIIASVAVASAAASSSH
jgi:golgi phosphoprotein 3